MTKYVLKYFDTRGRAEVIRMMFAYANVDYEDRRVSSDEWRRIRKNNPNAFSLPWLEMNGEVYCQAKAIAEYVASTLDLLPNDALGMLKAHMVIDTAFDLNAAFFGVVHESTEYEKNAKKFMQKEALRYCSELELLCEKSTKWMIGEKLTLCDLYVYETINSKVSSIDPTFIDEYPRLKGIYNKVRQLEELHDYFLYKRAGWNLEVRPRHLELKNRYIASYEIETKSLGSFGSGRNVCVEIMLGSEDDNTQLLKLNRHTAITKKPLFGKDSSDVFLVDGKNLSEISHIKINITNECELADWLLETIAIKNLSTKKTLKFRLGNNFEIGKEPIRIPSKEKSKKLNKKAKETEKNAEQADEKKQNIPVEVPADKMTEEDKETPIETPEAADKDEVNEVKESDQAEIAETEDVKMEDEEVKEEPEEPEEIKDGSEISEPENEKYASKHIGSITTKNDGSPKNNHRNSVRDTEIKIGHKHSAGNVTVKEAEDHPIEHIRSSEIKDKDVLSTNSLNKPVSGDESKILTELLEHEQEKEKNSHDVILDEDENDNELHNEDSVVEEAQDEENIGSKENDVELEMENEQPAEEINKNNDAVDVETEEVQMEDEDAAAAEKEKLDMAAGEISKSEASIPDKNEELDGEKVIESLSFNRVDASPNVS
ncbi:hypothetical protein SNEBB_001945 [Seison nebaliae]|nr:hypothetical protein SNEBB_001945 [Seison nebaliae]